MPSATTLRRDWRRPLRTYANGFDRIGVGVGFRPGLVFDLYDPAGNRLGWGRVTGLGDIELFDAASNRLGSVRPTFRPFVRTGRTTRQYVPQQMEALKEGEILEIGPEGKRGVWRTIGANPIFIEVAKGESVPKAIQRIQEEKKSSSKETGNGTGSPVRRSASFLLNKVFRDPGKSMQVAEEFHRVIGDAVSMQDLHATYVAPLGLDEEELSVRVSSSGTAIFATKGSIDGEPVDIIRTFQRGPDGGLEVGHELFDLPASAQGRGIAGRVYAAQEDLYRKMGVRRASMIANGTIGKYAWALHGFDFEDPGERERVASRMRAIGRNVLGVEPPKDFGRMTHAWEFATSSIGEPIRLTGELRSKILRDLPGKRSELSDLKDGDYEFGKLAMILNGKWYAVKDYGPDSNSEGAKIGRAYLSKKVKKTAEAAPVREGDGRFGQDSAVFHAELGGWPDDGEGVAAVQAALGASPKKAVEAIILEHPDWDREQIKMELRRQQKEVPQ